MSKLSKFASHLAPPALRQITLKVAEVNGVNLGQGTCQLPVPQLVQDAAIESIREGINRYTIPRGLASLRSALAHKLTRDNGFPTLDIEKEIVVTSGATGAYETVCAALLNPGDNAIIIEPYYPYHLKALEKYGAKIHYLPLNTKDWSFDSEELEKLLKLKPKFLVLTNPGNPHGKVFSREEIELIGKLCEEYDTYVIADETYEYLTYDGRPHISAATLPSLKSRTFTVGSYSKTFSITGWRIGYVVCPPEFTDTLVGLHDLTYICAPSAFQEAVARSIMTIPKSFYEGLRLKYQAKRELLCETLQSVGLKPRSPQGSYYIIADYSERFPKLSSYAFVEDMIRRVGVGAVPSDDFTQDASKNQWVRFCYAVEDPVLLDAANRLSGL